MKLAIIGLGLIGGSLAKAAAQTGRYDIYGEDISRSVISMALGDKAIQGVVTPEILEDCDIILVALWPGDTVNWILKNSPYFKGGALVIDCAGVKQEICTPVWEKSRAEKWHFIGGHPMAGREYSGYEASLPDLFRNAPMILTPDSAEDPSVVQMASGFFMDIGFNRIQICTPLEHDSVIAFTSQLAHVVSSAYIKSPMSLKHRGFSAGSLKDLTRVARLNEDMWTELFLHNRECLTAEIDHLIARLACYREAIARGDGNELKKLLREGRELKERLDNETHKG